MPVQAADPLTFFLILAVATLLLTLAAGGVLVGVLLLRRASPAVGSAVLAGAVIASVGAAAMFLNFGDAVNSTASTYAAGAEKLYGVELSRAQIDALRFPQSEPDKPILAGATSAVIVDNGRRTEALVHLAYDGKMLLLGTIRSDGNFIELDRR